MMQCYDDAQHQDNRNDGKDIDRTPSDPATFSQKEIYDILHGSSWFRALPEFLIEPMMSRSCLHHYENGKMIHYRGDESMMLYAVISGSVKVSSVSTDGRECIFRFLSPGNWFGEIGIIDKSVRTHDGQGHWEDNVADDSVP